MKLLLSVYKDTGKYYTSNVIETDIDVIKQDAEYMQLIRDNCPAKLTDGYMIVKNEDDDGQFVDRLYMLNQLLERSKSLKSVLSVMLSDLTNTDDLNPGSSDEEFIEYIVQFLSEKNDRTCPFKNYELKGFCPDIEKCGNAKVGIDCIDADEFFGPEHIAVWQNFINKTCK